MSNKDVTVCEISKMIDQSRSRPRGYIVKAATQYVKIGDREIPICDQYAHFLKIDESTGRAAKSVNTGYVLSGLSELNLNEPLSPENQKLLEVLNARIKNFDGSMIEPTDSEHEEI